MTAKAQGFQRFADESELIKWLISEKKAENVTAARKWIRRNVPLETDYQGDILSYLNNDLERPAAFAWKNQAGPYQRQGIPDVIACIKGEFYAFEVKRPFIGVTSDMQNKVITEMINAGGHAYVVSYVSEVRDIITKDFGMLEDAETDPLKRRRK